MMRRIRVAITYIAYPVAMGRYFHEALIQRPDVEVWSAGPYTGRSIPWKGGMHLPEKYLLKPSHDLPLTQPPMISYPVLEIKKPWVPDLWLEINGGLTAIGRPVSAPLAMVLSDPHVLGDFYGPQRHRADYIFNMQTPYMKPGDIWLPYGYSKLWHTPTRIPFANREYDAALIGLQYDQRTKLVNRLRQPNKHPHRDGAGFNVFYDTGPSYDDARDIYHNTRVGLNWSSLEDTTARCFELMALGLPAVMNRVPDLMEMFKDRQDFLGFNSEDEAVAMVHELLAKPDWADEIAQAGIKAVEPHSWGARIEQIFKEVGIE